MAVFLVVVAMAVTLGVLEVMFWMVKVVDDTDYGYIFSPSKDITRKFVSTGITEKKK